MKTRVRTSPTRRRSGEDLWAAPAALVLLAVALLAVGFLYLRQTSIIATGGYDLARLEAEQSRWEIKNRQLSYQVSELSSMQRVDKEARERLEMTAPQDLVFLKAR